VLVGVLAVGVLLVAGVLAVVAGGGVVAVVAAVEEPPLEELPQPANASMPIASINAESLGMERVFAATCA
jgi:hypothetical protein